MNTTLRRLLPVLVLATVVVAAGPVTAARAADDYRDPVDITFPVKAPTTYRDDYANGRSGGRVHRSTDLFGAAGSPVVAARGGVVVWLPSREAGNAGFAIQVLGDDGRVYAYYHLGPAGGRLGQAVARDVKQGSTVKRGQYLGTLGDSGNAAGGAPHLHFEIHDSQVTDPYGSNRRNPYASLRAAQGLPFDVPAAAPAVDSQTPSAALPVLRLGARGPAVVEWQTQLNHTRPGNELATDGAFGPRTERATAIFQRSVGLGPSGLGVVGPKTREALDRVLREQTVAASRTKPAAPAKPAVTGDPVLRRGDRGPAVKQWQRQLNHTRKGNELGLDGVFGPRTERATKIFQQSVGLGPRGLGVVGPKTRAALDRVLRRR